MGVCADLSGPLVLHSTLLLTSSHNSPKVIADQLRDHSRIQDPLIAMFLALSPSFCVVTTTPY